MDYINSNQSALFIGWFIIFLLLIFFWLLLKKTLASNDQSNSNSISKDIINNSDDDSQKCSYLVEPHMIDDDSSKYSYSAKPHMMTQTEEKFFITLNEIFSQHFYIFPQVHLSKLLNHKIKNQSQYGAFLHINSKSVDFVLCRKTNLESVCAIELDDYTHNWNSRRERDDEVKRIFKQANFPLIRISNPQNLTHQEIIDLIRKKVTETNSDQ